MPVQDSKHVLWYTGWVYLEEGCEFVHEREHVAEVNKGNVDDGSQQHEHDGIHVLDLK